MPDQLYADSDLAARLRISRSWIRKQRMYRKNGLPHCLTIDPVMIGSAPRYKASDVETWLAAQSAKIA
jgi:predicted DNA-binding transcriptional regulator AlpA